MPNCRSGGFGILRSELQLLLNSLVDHAVLGHTLVALKNARHLSRPAAGIGSTATIELLDSFRGDDVWVEEQDNSLYVVHLDMEAHEDGDPDPERWIIVNSDSPLFGPLRDFHQRERKRRWTMKEGPRVFYTEDPETLGAGVRLAYAPYTSIPRIDRSIVSSPCAMEASLASPARNGMDHVGQAFRHRWRRDVHRGRLATGRCSAMSGKPRAFGWIADHGTGSRSP